MLFVHHVMMEPAQQGQVVWIGFAVVGPMDGVMGITHLSGHFTVIMRCEYRRRDLPQFAGAATELRARGRDNERSSVALPAIGGEDLGGSGCRAFSLGIRVCWVSGSGSGASRSSSGA